MTVMGMVYESDGSVAMATKPKERQFQVVPMPGVFSRGRWKCWDYKDSSDTPVFNPEERDILEFDARADRGDILTANGGGQEEPIFLTPPRETFEPHGSSTIMVTSMALHESSPHVSNVTTAVSSLSALEPVVLTSASIPPNISVIATDGHRPGTIPPMQSPSLPSTVHNAFSSLTGHSHSTINMLDGTRSAMTESNEMYERLCMGLGFVFDLSHRCHGSRVTHFVHDRATSLRRTLDRPPI